MSFEVKLSGALHVPVKEVCKDPYFFFLIIKTPYSKRLAFQCILCAAPPLSHQVISEKILHSKAHLKISFSNPTTSLFDSLMSVRCFMKSLPTSFIGPQKSSASFIFNIFGAVTVLKRCQFSP